LRGVRIDYVLHLVPSSTGGCSDEGGVVEPGEESGD